MELLREAGESTGFFRMTEASVSLLAGASSHAMFVLFRTEDALARCKAHRGRSVGVDRSMALITVGADARITTQTAQQPIVGFLLTHSGLMGNLSLNGSRITPPGI